MANRLLMNVDEVIEELGVSRTFAYKLIQKLNKELEAKGFIVISGKVNRKYFEEQFYGMAEEKQKDLLIKVNRSFKKS